MNVLRLLWSYVRAAVKFVLSSVIAGFVLTLLLFYGLFINYVEQYQVGLAWNFATGKVTLQQPGLYFTSPFTLISRIDTRPVRVCITSSSRAYNCKLAQFDVGHYQEFVATEGHRYYWWANRISFNWGYPEEYRGMRDIIRGYTFGSVTYPFIRILTES